ncbi:protein containing Intermediate filament [gut metagenome]|uniref:Protein containing Intermediate filament n=1 Tax=gut metagenome TaxID=749906 RepID=J9GVS2_9ZZZZ
MQTVDDPENSVNTNLSFSELDRENQKITIRNNGSEAVLMDGHILFSKRGGEFFRFPDGTQVLPGEYITVSCRGTWEDGELLWDEDKVWKKDDSARLYDPNFILLDEISK